MWLRTLRSTAWRRRVTLWLALGYLACGAGAAISAQSPAVSLAQAEDLALRRNTDFRVAESQVQAAEGQLKIAREFPNPTLNLSTAKISTDGTPEGTAWGNSLLNRAYDSIVSLDQQFLIGKRGVMAEVANQGLRAAEFQRDDARRLLLKAVIQAYIGSQAALEQSKAQAQSAAALRKEAEIAGQRLRTGDISRSDQAQIEIAADQDDLNAQSLLATARQATIALELLLGEPSPQGTTVLSDSISSLAQGPAGELAAVAKRPDVAAAEANASQAESALTLQRRGRIPDVTVSVQYERNPPAQPNTVGVGLSLPLPLWNQHGGEILAAKASRDEAQILLEKARLQAAVDVASARIAYAEAAQRAQRYGTVLLPKSAAVVASVTYAYEKGGASLVDLLEAQRNDTAIRVAAVQAEADFADAAASLQAALGRLDPPSAP